MPSVPLKKNRKQSPEHIAKRTASRLATLAARPKPVSKEWLESEYVGKGRSCPDIASELERDPKTIWSWLKFYGIPTRSRGAESSPATFTPGQPGTFTGKKHSAKSKELIRQARAKDGGVPYLRNGVHWLQTVPKKQHPNWKGGVTPERQSFYSSDEWKDACRQVWQRADAKCERCGLDHRNVRRTQTFHVHHVVSFAVRELRANVDNLRLLCPSCHRWVHSNANVDSELLGDWS